MNDEPDYINQLCPRCHHAMISLSGYVAEGSCDEDDTETSDEAAFWIGGVTLWVGKRLVDGLWGALRRRRLAPIAERYPHSLYCTSCSYVQRRA